ncbi:polyprenyl synthetase family protein [Paenibacillus oryzisoli]|uniref:polyprenyl synthetase family protein n=1 Tax=Paenibacillus oryzisoli TaxID=1850517 RepID=UPI003D2AC624
MGMEDIQGHLYRMIDTYMYDEDFKSLLIACLADQESSSHAWSKITLSTHAMLGGVSPHIYRRAALTELLILILDMVDDLQDRDSVSKPWMQVPLASALNAVLAFVAGAIAELGELGIRDHILAEVGKILARSVCGQHKDVVNSVTTPDEYLVMTQEKSGSLFRLACYMGYAGESCSPENVERLHQLADCLGLIHQIQNDMRDLVRFDEKSDLLARKKTLPILYLLSIEDEAFAQLKAYYAGELSAEFLGREREAVLQIIHDSGCLEYARIVQSVCVQKAEEIYQELDAQSPWKERFRQIAWGDYAACAEESAQAEA